VHCSGYVLGIRRVAKCPDPLPSHSLLCFRRFTGFSGGRGGILDGLSAWHPQGSKIFPGKPGRREPTVAYTPSVSLTSLGAAKIVFQTNNYQIPPKQLCGPHPYASRHCTPKLFKRVLYPLYLQKSSRPKHPPCQSNGSHTPHPYIKNLTTLFPYVSVKLSGPPTLPKNYGRF
jgi:hypothetical protein